MHITSPSVTVSFTFTCTPEEAEKIGQDAHDILMADGQSIEPNLLSPEFKKLLTVLELLPQQVK